jgi:hypothetical protein
MVVLGKAASSSEFEGASPMEVALRLRPSFEVIGRVSSSFTREELLREPSLYCANPSFLREHGGPVANAIYNSIPRWFFELPENRGLLPNIDIRVHDLRTGDYPAYPGLHCDASQRELTFGGAAADRKTVCNNVICNVSSHPEGVSNTAFLKEELDIRISAGLSDIECWRQVDERLTPLPNGLHLERTRDGDLIRFGTDALHMVQPAVRDGVRVFFRLSMWANRDGVNGSLAFQDQVYRLVERVEPFELTSVQDRRSAHTATALAPRSYPAPTLPLRFDTERSYRDASFDYLSRSAGPVVRTLLEAVPQALDQNGIGTEVLTRLRFDVHALRLYKGDLPDQAIWQPLHTTHGRTVLFAHSSAERDGGVRVQFLESRSTTQDGFICLPDSADRTFRYLPAGRQGWSLLLRAVLPESEVPVRNIPVRQNLIYMAAR